MRLRDGQLRLRGQLAELYRRACGGLQYRLDGAYTDPPEARRHPTQRRGIRPGVEVDEQPGSGHVQVTPRIGVGDAEVLEQRPCGGPQRWAGDDANTVLGLRSDPATKLRQLHIGHGRRDGMQFEGRAPAVHLHPWSLGWLDLEPWVRWHPPGAGWRQPNAEAKLR